MTVGVTSLLRSLAPTTILDLLRWDEEHSPWRFRLGVLYQTRRPVLVVPPNNLGLSGAASGAAIAVPFKKRKREAETHGLSNRDLDAFPTISQRSGPHPRALSLGIGAARTLNMPEASGR